MRLRPRLPRSLAGRLVASAMAVALVLLLLTGLLLSYLFRVTVERNFDSHLQAVMNGLLSHLELDDGGRAYLRGQLADPRFRLPLSGWYWQITPIDDAGRALASASLLEQRFDPPPAASPLRDAAGVARYYATDASGHTLRVVEQRYTLFGSRRYSVLVAGNFDELGAEVTAFTGTLAGVFVVLALSLITAIFVQVRYGLRPLKRLHDQLGEIREGRREQLDEDYPDEIRPVAHELNLLLRANREIIERARTQAGNLAHALKTPLSVLINEAQATGGRLADKVLEQVGLMRDQVNLHLDRARRAAVASTLVARTPVCDVLAALVRTLARIYRDRDIAVDTECGQGLLFRGERQDLEEMIGNLLDNAFKYARGRIRVSVTVETARPHARRWLILRIEDDGPGLPAADRARALKRGQRLDETKPGSGLGLSIVSETAGMYGGGIRLDDSDLGGLAVVLRLPAA
ncbi:MAG TPA: HAMP domain-containing protein [Thermopetrobacter sp.]|nr:HAMP domain-containing protein [Thermopetrobacter sp.]